jgi:hypothetical protein
MHSLNQATLASTVAAERVAEGSRARARFRPDRPPPVVRASIRFRRRAAY